MTRPSRIDAKMLQQHARDCERMADETSDLFTRDSLRELSLEFRRAARTLEHGMNSPEPGRSSKRRSLSCRRNSQSKVERRKRGPDRRQRSAS
jgi:hypothetical protein